MAEAREDWAESAVIKGEELGEYLIEQFRNQDSNIYVRAYSVVVKKSGIDEDGLARYVADRFKYFVFSKDQIHQLREEDKSAHRRAEKIAKVKEDYIKDGTLGEFFLFLLTDGFLDVPMISHKIANKQSFEHEVYGADGIFFGEHQGEEKIGIGEAKMQKSFSAALEDAIESIYRFHSTDSASAWEQELNVAPAQLSGNLKRPEQVEKLAEILTEENYADYPVFHPIFLSYETRQLSDIDVGNVEMKVVSEKIKDHMESSDYIRRCKAKIEKTESTEIKVADLVFLFLPVSDLDRFRKKVLVEVFPSLEYVMGDVLKSMDGGGDN